MVCFGIQICFWNFDVFILFYNNTTGNAPYVDEIIVYEEIELQACCISIQFWIYRLPRDIFNNYL